MLRLLVHTLHDGFPGQEAYEGTALDITLEEGHYDHTCLMAGHMVAYLQDMYAGDKVRVQVFLHDELKWSSSGPMGRPDELIEELAKILEGGKLSGSW